MPDLRPFVEADRAALGPLGPAIARAALHLVAEEEGGIVGSVQVLPTARAARHMGLILRVAEDRWTGGLPALLLERARGFAQEHGADRLHAAHLDTDAALAAFLHASGFEPFERYLNSRLALAGFEPARFADALARVERKGVRLLTYADLADDLRSRRRLYDLEVAARAVQPFRDSGRYVPPSFEAFQREVAAADPSRLFLAEADERLVGIVTGFDDCFTGVRPEWQGRGIATALKVRALTAAKAAGMEAVTTENHEDNAAMLAVNRRLGFVPGPVETNLRLML